MEKEQTDAFLSELIGLFGEVQVLVRLAAHFDYLFQEGVIRREEEKEEIRKWLAVIDDRISADESGL